jgi:hypothetical protein
MQEVTVAFSVGGFCIVHFARFVKSYFRWVIGYQHAGNSLAPNAAFKFALDAQLLDSGMT